MKLKTGLFISYIVLLAFAARVNAQGNTPPYTISHLAAAEKLINITGMTDSRFSLMRKSTIETIGEKVPAANKAVYVAEMTAFFDKYIPLNAFKDRFVRLYAESFSEQELNQLSEFYATPLGKKVSAVLPEVMQKGMLDNQRIIQDHQDELAAIISKSLTN
jgi:hypothetical protein